MSEAKPYTLKQNYPFMTELPKGWTLKKFEELLFERRNGIYKKKEFHGRGTKIINMGELFGYDFISNQNMKRVELNEKELKKYLVQDGDLLFARRSLVLEGSGKCSLIVRPFQDTTFESSIILARLNKNVAYPKFYYYLFRSPLGRALMASIATRTAVSGITGSNLVQLKVPHPPLPIQRKIAAILSAYDDLIENNTRRIEILEEMARNLYREWFVNFRFPGHEQVKMVDSDLGLIPEGWEIKPLSEVCERINYGYTAKAKTDPIGLKFLRITDIVPHSINWDSVPYCEISDKGIQKFRLEEGDIVIARTGATVGYAKRLNKRHPDSVFASYLVRLRINEQSNSHYIGVIVESDTYKNWLS